MSGSRKTTSLRETYLVTEKLTRVAESQIDEIEGELGFSLPGNYREYATTLGIGEYCNIFSLYEPGRIRHSKTFMQDTFGDRSFWDGAQVDLTTEEILQCIPFAGTSNGDYFVIHPKRPESVFALPRGDDNIVAIASAGIHLEDIYWDTIGDHDYPSFRQFESSVDRRQFEMGRARSEMIPKGGITLDELKNWLALNLGTQGHHSEETVLATSAHSHVFLRSIQGWVYAAAHSGRNVGRIMVRFDKNCAALADTVRVYMNSRGYAERGIR